jgi:hypothetical protein
LGITFWLRAKPQAHRGIRARRLRDRLQDEDVAALPVLPSKSDPLLAVPDFDATGERPVPLE